ncbi:MAG: acyltransferase family protein [Bacteroidales bacterium]|nr:acyltransferase family protein [Bacteroidales bacterium]
MNKGYFWIDNLRVIATLSVILLHVSAVPVTQFGIIDIGIWWAGNILNGSVRFCVPIFFMISGALLLSKDYTLSIFIKKRFLRLLPPFIFWSLIYITYRLVIDFHNGLTMSFFEICKYVIIKLCQGSSDHLWFVYYIMGLYLVIPIIRKWIKNADNNEIIYFLSIWGVTLIINFSFLKTYKPSFNLIYFSGHLGYMVLGYFLSENINKILNNKWIALAMVAVGNLLTILGTYFLSEKINSFDTSLYVYLTPNVALSAIGIFLLFKNLEIKSVVYFNLVNVISKNSYGIYLIHMLVLAIISKVGINWEMATPAISLVIVTFVCFFVSCCVIFIMNKIKILNKIAG